MLSQHEKTKKNQRGKLITNAQCKGNKGEIEAGRIVKDIPIW